MKSNKGIRLLYRVKRQLLSRVGLARVVVLAILLFFLLGLSYPIIRLKLALEPYTTQKLDQTGNRTNLVILGIGGTGHESPDLTDSIILISLDHATSTTTLISIPRDLWVNSLKAKINTAYYYGKQNGGPEAGLKLAKSAVSEMLGQPIHYGLVLDFATFAQAIDLVGGIDVQVETGFVDNQYPISGKENDLCGGDKTYACRYETVEFKPGIEHMSGERALIYVRSRHSQDLTAGTDFARADRQRAVINGFRKKLETSKSVSGLKTLVSIYQLFKSQTYTDIPESTYKDALTFALVSRGQPLRSFSLGSSDAVLHPKDATPYQNQWVLIPKDNNLESIYSYISGVLGDSK